MDELCSQIAIHCSEYESCEKIWGEISIKVAYAGQDVASARQIFDQMVHKANEMDQCLDDGKLKRHMSSAAGYKKLRMALIAMTVQKQKHSHTAAAMAVSAPA